MGIIDRGLNTRAVEIIPVPRVLSLEIHPKWFIMSQPFKMPLATGVTVPRIHRPGKSQEEGFVRQKGRSSTGKALATKPWGA